MRLEQATDIAVAFSSEHSGSADLVPVQVKDRKHSPVAARVQKTRSFPRTFEWRCLRFPVADNGNGDEIGVVERGAERVHQNVAELSPFVDRSRRGYTDVTGNAAGRRELAEQLPEARTIAADSWVHFAVSAL